MELQGRCPAVSHLDHEPEMKIFKTPVAKYYIIAAFLSNIHSVLYGNQTVSRVLRQQERVGNLSVAG
jgi:hypothetical protein